MTTTRSRWTTAWSCRRSAWASSAAAYLNEEAVGRAIAASGIAREDIFLTTKVWTQDAGEEATKKAVDTSLRNLGLDYLDLIERTGSAPAVNQIETHPYFQRADDQRLMTERGVQHQSWGGFAEGKNNILSDPT